MLELNQQNGTDRISRFIQSLIMKEFPKEYLIGMEFGVAYGGGVEALGILRKDHGFVYGFDTFEGHPKQLATSLDAHEATCMDDQYAAHGMDTLSYEYIRDGLDLRGLYNVILVKGLIDSNCCQGIPKIHYCLLDLDILASMKTGYDAVKRRIVIGGYLLLHDVVGHERLPGHQWLPELHQWYLELKKDPQWEVVFEGKQEFLAVLRRVR